jgi:hypothetical protein
MWGESAECGPSRCAFFMKYYLDDEGELNKMNGIGNIT